jgi:hypothetical protein
MKRVEIKAEEGTLKQIEKLKEEFKQIQADISKARKRARDTKIAEIKSMNIMPKIKMIEATYHPNDIKKVADLLDELRAEVQPLLDEIEYEKCQRLIKHISSNLKNGEIEKANANYARVMKIYSNLPKELKTLVYHECIELHKEIEGALRN